MIKEQKEARARNVEVLKRNYPHVDADKLQNALYSLALACERNALNLCNTPNWPDEREKLRARFDAICIKYRVVLSGCVSGDPRGYCLKLHLPNGDWNSLGGKEAGYGIGSI